MANNPDVLPSPDPEFDTLQKLIVQKVTTNAVDWDIPAGEITKLTDAQTPWTNTWGIAQFKTNVTSAQREAKDVARVEYEKVLRPFIQKWIFRNESMTNDDIVECGLKPRDTTRTPAVKIGVVEGVTAETGQPLEITATCPKVDKAQYYGCIITETAPLPEGVSITPDNKIMFTQLNFPNPGPQMTAMAFDLSPQRVKRFNGLQHNVTYYVYFYIVNSAGVSPLTAAVSVLCW